MRNGPTEVWVTTGSNKNVAEEYAPQVKDGVQECYIEAVPGENFEIQCTCDVHDLAIQVFLDGEQQCNQFKSMTRLQATVDSKRVGPDTIRKFLFNNITLTDDNDLACQDEQIIKNLGTITVKLYRVIQRFASAPSTSAGTYADTAPRSFHEMSKKARLSATTGHGEVEYARPSSNVDVVWMERPESPWKTYTFYYRSGDILEAEGMRPVRRAIEPPPDPAASASTSRQSQSAGTSNQAASSSSRRNQGTKRSAVDEEEMSELERLRAENKRLRAERTKREDSEGELKPIVDRRPSGSAAAKKRQVIVIDD